MRIVCPESKSQLFVNTPINVKIDRLKFLETPQSLSHMLNNSVLHSKVLSAVCDCGKSISCKFLAEIKRIYGPVWFCTLSLCYLDDP